MAKLTRCPTCGGPVSSSAASCPKCGHPMKGERQSRGLASSIARVGCLGFMVIFGSAALVTVMGQRGTRQQPPSAAAVSDSPRLNRAEWIPPAAPPGLDALPAGVTVEVATVLVAADRSVFDALRAGADPMTFHNRTQKFGVKPGSLARVLGQDGDAVHVQMEEGNWKGRDGWISLRFARRPPTEAELKGDVKFGLTLGQRRELFSLSHRIGIYAVFEADRLVPTELRNGDVASFTKAQRRHGEVAEEIETRYDEMLRARYPGLTRHDMALIVYEGKEQNWPQPRIEKGDPPPIR